MRFAALAALLTVALTATHLAYVGPARAQAPGDVARARELFEEGVALFDSDRLDEAESRFRASLAIRDSQSVRFNLATLLMRRGRLLEASELFRVVAAAAQIPDDVRADASGRVAEIQPRLAQLTLTLPDAVRGATVRLDDRVLSSGELGRPIPSDPGEHAITVEQGSEVLAERSLRLAEGERRTVALVTVASPTEAAGTVSPNGDPGTSSDGGGDAEPIWLYVVIGVAIAALIGAGIAIGVVVEEGRYFSGNVGPGRIIVM